MSLVVADRLLETSTTTGTGVYTLGGAVAGFRGFSAACANGDTVEAFVEEVDANGVPAGGWEVGIYTWGTGGTLARSSIIASSNSNAAVNWSAGTRRIGVGLTATRLVMLMTGVGIAPLSTDSTTNLNATSGNAGNYTRFTNSAAKTYTFSDAVSYVIGQAYHGRNVGAGDLTLTKVGTFVLNPPAGGSLVVPQGGTFTVKIVAAAEADVFGVTNP